VRELAELIGVSQSAASVWVRDIRLTPAQRRELDERGERGRAIARARKATRARDLRWSYQEEGRRLARERGSRYAAGCMLYWAEGAKDRNRLKVTNSDPELLGFFASFLRVEFGVAPEQIGCTATSSRTTSTGSARSRTSGSGASSSRVRPSASRPSTSSRSTASERGSESSPTEHPPWSSTAPESSRRSSARFRSTAASTGRSGSTDSRRAARIPA
jgi:hypothetical protein